MKGSIAGMGRLAGAAWFGLALLAATADANAAEFNVPSTDIGKTDVHAAELPPEPGVYLLGIGILQRFHDLADANGHSVFPDTSGGPSIANMGFLFVYPGEVFGGRLASSIALGYGRNDLTITKLVPNLSHRNRGAFDAYGDFLFWSRSWYDLPPGAAGGPPPAGFPLPAPPGFTLGFGLAGSIPVGKFDNTRVGNPGFNNWVLAPNAAVTYRTRPILLDGTEFSARLFYNHVFERPDSTGGFTYKDGDYVNLDWAITERWSRHQFGPTGSFLWQVQDDSGSPAKPALDGSRMEKVQVGAIWSIDIPEIRSNVAFKYVHDVSGENVMLGDTFTLRFVHKLGF